MTDPRTALVVGASRALGLALTEELLTRGWRVVATKRGTGPAPLDELTGRFAEQLTIEHVDITEPEQVARLRARLDGTALDLLFVNAGITNRDEPVEEVPTEEFVDVMVTNALSPLRVVDDLRDLVPADGAIGIMSSRQGSVGLNERGGHEVYRASKSALNQLVRSYAARHRDDTRTLLLIHPGWVQTELGGAGAPLTVEQSVRGVADVLEQHGHDGGLQFLDHEGGAVAW